MREQAEACIERIEGVEAELLNTRTPQPAQHIQSVFEAVWGDAAAHDTTNATAEVMQPEGRQCHH